MAIAQSPLQRNVALLHRLSVDHLTTQQLTQFRSAITAVQAISDDRGYQHWAGIHGLPLPIYCQHHTNLFLPWHRAYLYFFELALQDQVAETMFPWWDWTSPASHTVGLPGAYTAADANNAPNALFSSPINELARSQAGPTAPAATFRHHDLPIRLPTIVQINTILNLNDFLDFSKQVENVHDGIHVWVGGTMAEIPLAAYDPIFYAHHAMIDRLWYLWQLRHPTAGVPQNMLDQALPPFAMTVRQTLSTTSLGYDYAASATTTSGTP